MAICAGLWPSLAPLVLLAIGGHLWSIPVWGPLGAAWTTSGTMLVGASTGYFAARFLGSVQLRFGSLARALLLCALGFGVSMIGPTGSSAWLLVGLPGIGVVARRDLWVVGRAYHA